MVLYEDTRQQAGNKDRHAFMAAYAFHIRTQVFRPHGEDIILLQRDPAFPLFPQMISGSILTGKGPLVHKRKTGR